jgi:hypothetical protein
MFPPLAGGKTLVSKAFAVGDSGLEGVTSALSRKPGR